MSSVSPRARSTARWSYGCQSCRIVQVVGGRRAVDQTVVPLDDLDDRPGQPATDQGSRAHPGGHRERVPQQFAEHVTDSRLAVTTFTLSVHWRPERPYPGGVTMLDRLSAEKYILLTTFRKDGRAVPTPVWAVRDGEALAVWTPGRLGQGQADPQQRAR